MKVNKKSQASEDIENVAMFIAQNNLDAGLKFISAVSDSIAVLAENPYIGAKHTYKIPSLKEMRIWPVQSYGKYLILYIPRDGIIDILRVLHSSSDYNRILGK